MHPVMKRYLKRIALTVLMLLLLLNAWAFNMVWHIMHFDKPCKGCFVSPEKLSTGKKISTLIWGLDNPKPTDDSVPKIPYQVVGLKTAKGLHIDAWDMPADSGEVNGTVIILHGFRGNKSGFLPVADFFHRLGYNCFMIDFAGHGNSEGMQTSMGYYESEQVKLAYQYVKTKHNGKVILFGSSMGAVAALRAVAKDSVAPDMLLLEAPFGTLLQATKNRLDMVNVPNFPISQLLVFWGGVQEGYWGFANQPEQYAKAVHVPVLLMYGMLDQKVTLQETQSIFANLQSTKDLHLFEHSGHEDFCVSEPEAFAVAIKTFLARR